MVYTPLKLLQLLTAGILGNTSAEVLDFDPLFCTKYR